MEIDGYKFVRLGNQTVGQEIYLEDGTTGRLWKEPGTVTYKRGIMVHIEKGGREQLMGADRGVYIQKKD